MFIDFWCKFPYKLRPDTPLSPTKGRAPQEWHLSPTITSRVLIRKQLCTDYYGLPRGFPCGPCVLLVPSTNHSFPSHTRCFPISVSWDHRETRPIWQSELSKRLSYAPPNYPFQQSSVWSRTFWSTWLDLHGCAQPYLTPQPTADAKTRSRGVPISYALGMTPAMSLSFGHRKSSNVKAVKCSLELSQAWDIPQAFDRRTLDPYVPSVYLH
jgi:hypothetical protein